MNKRPCISLGLLFVGTALLAQDTLETTYPGTSQRWIKRFESRKKIDETIFHENDQVWMQVRYVNGQEKWNWFYENGTPYFVATIENDSLEELYQITYENGQVAEKIEFKDNLENGSAKFYYPNGQLAMKGNYHRGMMSDNWMFLTTEGQPANGPWRWYFAADSSRLRMNGEVRNGKMSGTWTYWSVVNLGTNNEVSFQKEIEPISETIR